MSWAVAPYWIRITEAGEQRVRVRCEAYRSGRYFLQRWFVLDCNAGGHCIGTHTNEMALREALERDGYRPDDRSPRDATR